MLATVVRRISRLVPGHRMPRGIDRWTIVRIGVVAVTVYAAVRAASEFGRPYIFFDLQIYHGAVAWWAGGGELYEYVHPTFHLGFTYPPFGALAMLPMAVLGTQTAAWANVVLSLLALAAVLAALLVPIADRHGWPRWFVVATALPLAAALEPGRETLGYGQVNLLLFGLIIADLVGLRWQARRPARAAGATTARLLARRFLFSGAWAGVGIGLATAVKLTPALFIVYFVVARQWRAAMTAIGTTVAVTTFGFVAAGRESAVYFTSVLWETNRVGAADMTPNQSLAGLLARMYDSVETPGLLWLSFSLVLVVIGLSRAANAHGEGDELTAFTLVGLTSNVVSPISWTHHLVWVIPAVVILVDTVLRRRMASRMLSSRGVGAGVAAARGLAVGQSLTGLRTPIWFPALTGLRHAVAALGLYLLFLVSPIWPYEHQLPQVSHYADGLFGVLMENSFALALIALVVVLPWRPGAEPVFPAESGLRAASRPLPAGVR